MSMGSVWLWAVLLAFSVLGKSISIAASKWLFQHNCKAVSPLLVPGIIAGASVPLTCPTMLAKTCQVGACLDPSVLHQLVWGSLSPLSSPLCHGPCVHLFQLPRLVSAQWGQCGLVSAPCAHPLRLGVYVHLFRLTACTLCPGGYFFLFLLCLEGPVHCPSLYDSPLSAPQFRPLHRLCLSVWAHPLCYALARFVCPITLGYLGLPSVLQGLCALAGCV